MIKNTRAKGCELEYEWRNRLRDSGLDPRAERTPMSGALAMMPSDIWTKLPFAFEAKFYQKIAIYKWWDQAIRGSSARKRPALVMKANNRPILVAIDGDEFTSILAYALRAGYPDKSL